MRFRKQEQNCYYQYSYAGESSEHLHNPPGGGGSSTPPQPHTTIDTPEVPLANFPSEPVTELIEETEVPLVALPKTGDSRRAGMLLTLFGITGLGTLFSAVIFGALGGHTFWRAKVPGPR